MPKLSEEDLLKDLDYKCERCQAECTKINAAEPEVGYISKVDGEFVRVCQNCYNEIPEDERAIKTLHDTAFLVIVKSNGGGVFMTTEGIPITYMRDPTPYDVISACQTVAEDIKEALTNQKLLARLAPLFAQKNSKLVIPR
jgi:hypothetical protein